MSSMMNAVVLHGSRDMRVEKIAHPELKPGMVVLRSRRVGICGSDLHYFQHGYCGPFVPDRPFVLGHEVTAEVAEIADDVSTVKIGDIVTVNPARNCGFCDECKNGRANLCRKTIMLGSASTTPPTNGGFAEFVSVRADQCFLLPPGMDDDLGTMMEPFAVALHALKRAGSVSCRRVLVTGGGTIGLLVAVAARAFGATPVVVSDVVASRRAAALRFGADAALDPASPNLGEEVRGLTGDGFDFVFEASGAPPALRQAFDLVRPGGTIVQIGTLGTNDIPLPANMVMVREINFIGSMRYGNVFGDAIRLAASGRVNLRPFVSGVLPFNESTKAMELAGDKDQALKIQVQIN